MIDRNPDGTVKAGSILNPGGKNQWDYRQRAEHQLDQILAELPEGIEGQDLSRRVIEKLLECAGKGEPWAMKLVLERMLPATTKHEVELHEGVAIEDLEAAIARFRPAAHGTVKPVTNGANGSSRGSA